MLLQMLSATSFQITLLTGRSWQDDVQLYVLGGVFLAASAVWVSSVQTEAIRICPIRTLGILWSCVPLGRLPIYLLFIQACTQSPCKHSDMVLCRRLGRCFPILWPQLW